MDTGGFGIKIGTDFCIICSQFYHGKMEIFDFLKTAEQNETFGAKVVTTNGFALHHGKSL